MDKQGKVVYVEIKQSQYYYESRILIVSKFRMFCSGLCNVCIW